MYGVKRDSILNQSKFFHVVDGLDLDPMHDQLEGHVVKHGLDSISKTWTRLVKHGLD